tara:strand:+ start:161 stop:787 length:627 start_codon:yes stop_codon:yes gene_type:complete
MGSLITALQNQSIAESNAAFANDPYAANPTNLGYTANPFGYTASPAVQQTAYPKYGVNATSPNIPDSYEDYDLTSLFSMLQGMQGTEGGPTQYTGLSPQAAEAPATGLMEQIATLASPVENAYQTPAYVAANQPAVVNEQEDDSSIEDRINAAIAQNNLASARGEYQRYALDTGRSVEAGKTFDSASKYRDAQRSLQEQYKNLLQSGE